MGLAMASDMLAGAEIDRLDRLREAADKAACPCLLLVEPQPQRLCGTAKQREAAMDRLNRVILAAQRIGASAAGCAIDAKADEPSMETAVERIRTLSISAERLDLHLLLQPTPGLTETADQIAELIKRVGGFRVGSLPDFEAAGAADDPRLYMRRMAPYAPFVIAASTGFDKKGAHQGYDLEMCARGLVDVGYDGSIVLDYRGEGDPIEGVNRTREVIEPILSGEAS